MCIISLKADIVSWSAYSGRIEINLPVTASTDSYGSGSYYRSGGSTEEGTHQAIVFSGTDYVRLIRNNASDQILWESSARVVLRIFVNVHL